MFAFINRAAWLHPRLSDPSAGDQSAAAHADLTSPALQMRAFPALSCFAYLSRVRGLIGTLLAGLAREPRTRQTSGSAPDRQPVRGRCDHVDVPDDALSWAEVAARRAVARNYWLCTTLPSGAPHAAPVWGVVAGGTLYLYSERRTVKARNISADPRVVVHLESGDDMAPCRLRRLTAPLDVLSTRRSQAL